MFKISLKIDTTSLTQAFTNPSRLSLQTLKPFQTVIIFTFASLLTSCTTKSAIPIVWTKIEDWRPPSIGPGYRSVFESTEAVQFCHSNPQGSLTFPILTQSSHRIFLDNQLIEEYGDSQFRWVWAFYGSPVVRCSIVGTGNHLRWEIYSFSKSLAHISGMPRAHHTYVSTEISTVSRIFGSGVFIVMALFALSLFRGKVQNKILYSLLLSMVFYSVSMLTTSPGYFNISGSMKTMQKISDTSVVIGTLLFFAVFHFLDLLKKSELVFIFFGSILTSGIIIGANNIDIMQESLNFMFPMWVGFFIIFAWRSGRKINLANPTLLSIFLFLASLIYSVTGINDILLTFGMYDGVFAYPYGVVSAFLMLTLSINEKITETYKERDLLRANLEKEVEIKTKELSEKATHLQHALEELSRSQDQLDEINMQLAHDIRSPLAALKTLSVDMHNFSEEKVSMMGIAVDRVYNIIDTLATKQKEPRSRITDVILIKVLLERVILEKIVQYRSYPQIEIRASLNNKNTDYFVNVNETEMARVLSNLIDNAVEAILGQGEVFVGLDNDDRHVIVSISDTGQGIPPELIPNLGQRGVTFGKTKGTGLGLYHSMKCINSWNGSIKIESPLSGGTKVTIALPYVVNGNRL